MTLSTLEQEILTHLHALSPPMQREVLDIVRNFASAKKGVSGKELLKFAGTIDTESLDAMEAAIENDCENVNARDW